MKMSMTVELPVPTNESLVRLAEGIDLSDNPVFYGKKVQSELKETVEAIAKNVSEYDGAEVTDLLNKINSEISDFQEMLSADAQPARLLRFFTKDNTRKMLRDKYEKTRENLQQLEDKLLKHQCMLMVKTELLNQFLNHALSGYKDLKMHIIAGEAKLQECREGKLAELKRQAEKHISEEAVFTYNRLSDDCSNFERRIADLKTTQAICMQSVVQIQLMQRVNTQLVQTIQNNLCNTIAAWMQNVANVFNAESNNIEAITASNLQLRATVDQALSIQNDSVNTQKEVIEDLQRIGQNLEQK